MHGANLICAQQRQCTVGKANLYLRAENLVCLQQFCAQQRKYLYISVQQIHLPDVANLYMCALVIHHGHTLQPVYNLVCAQQLCAQQYEQRKFIYKRAANLYPRQG